MSGTLHVSDILNCHWYKLPKFSIVPFNISPTIAPSAFDLVHLGHLGHLGPAPMGDNEHAFYCIIYRWSHMLHMDICLMHKHF